MARSDGSVVDFYAPALGNLSGVKLHRPIVAAAATPDGKGYWLVGSDGGVFNFGDARFLGSPGSTAVGKPIVGMAVTPDGGGYWLVSSDGGIFSYGDAKFYGSPGGTHLNKPIVAMAATPDGLGYWLVASDGGIFSYGDAKFYGSPGAHPLNKPIVAMSATPDGLGYWLVASDGGIFNYGDATFHGSAGARHLAAPIAAMAVTADGKGYWLADQDGSLYYFGDALHLGSAPSATDAATVVALVVTTAAVPQPPSTTTTSTTVAPRTTTTRSTTTTTTTKRATTTTTRRTTTTTTKRATTTTTTVPATTTTTTLPVPVIKGYPYPVQSSGFDVSWPQCSPNGSSRTRSLPGGPRFAVVGVNNGKINGFNPCFTAETLWGYGNLSVYIVLGPAPGGDTPLEATGPKAACAKKSNLCEGYDWGYNYATADIEFVAAKGVSPRMWWLDIETAEDWPTTKAAKAVNAAIIQGALNAIKAAGRRAGIYSTWYQWGKITGSYLATAAPPLWVAGAGPMSGNNDSAKAYCVRALQPGNPANVRSTSIGFAGGVPWLVQYGYGPGGVVDGLDHDYSCGTPKG